MLDTLKKMIIGTKLEPFARNLQAILKLGWSSDDLSIQRILKLSVREDSNCVDVGCHRGMFLRQMLLYAPKGEHYAFEPLPGFFKGLLQEYGHNPNVHLYETALSDVSGETTFQHVVSNPAMSGLKIRNYPRLDEKIQNITVATETLDNIIPAIRNINFIKIDVEGAELQVLRGAINTINRCHPVIVFEHGRGAAEYYGTSPDDIFSFLSERCSLKISLLNTYLENNGGHPLTRESFCEQFVIGQNYNFVAYP